MKTAVFLVLACVGVAMAAHDVDLFMTFMTDFNKVYSKEEMPQRFANFQENLRKIEELNASQDTAVYGVTQFSDMTEEEFLESLGMMSVHEMSSPEGLTSMPPSGENVVAPPAFDWNDKGKVQAVKNQGSCGSCWAFSATGSMESCNAVKGNSELLSLAEQELVDCDPQSGGCRGGWPDWAYHYVETGAKGGWETEDDYPYHARGGTCAFDESKAKAHQAGHTTLCLATSQRPSEQTDACDAGEMAKELFSNGALSVCLDARPLMSYHSGVISGASCRSDWQSHCVLATGYGTDNGVDFWNVKNSWGSHWGESGYFRIARGNNECGIEATVFHPVF